ncbi:hypothetical protein [Aquiflexum sp.]|uniref:hypothetical protein n=1 Tax=Aquiflexum sp. TaxID=1872584 RepID=UPI0035946718
MNIDCTFGKFKIIQTVSDDEELLILSKWDCLKNFFASSRIFLVNQKEAVFGVYLNKKECLETIDVLIKNIDYKDWDNLHLGSDHFIVKN